MIIMNKTALITGASRGIGKAIAYNLAKNGYDLYLVCHTNMEMLTEISMELTDKYQISIYNFCGDISNPDFVDYIFENIKHLDLLINNAGISANVLLQDMTNEEWHRVINTNLSSVFYTCRGAIKLMLPNHSGKIINISSMWGSVGASMEVAYSASKGGVNSFTKALAKELAPSNISVNALACGVIDTEMNDHLSPMEKASLANDIPAGRFADVNEVADTVYSIIQSPNYLTGQIIGLDGGYI